MTKKKALSILNQGQLQNPFPNVVGLKGNRFKKESFFFYIGRVHLSPIKDRSLTQTSFLGVHIKKVGLPALPPANCTGQLHPAYKQVRRYVPPPQEGV